MLGQIIPINNKDRLVIAKRNRQIQLERYEFFEKENNKIATTDRDDSIRSNERKIKFSNEIVLLEAICRNDINEVTYFLKQGVNPNSTTIDSLTGLHQCSIDGYNEMGALLLKFNANVNSADSEMWTPLHAAATCGNVEMCKLLIKHGADFLALNADGNMPYDICEGPEILTIIETEMAKRKITQDQIEEARDRPELLMLNSVKEHIKNRENLDQYDIQGVTPLHVACSLGYNKVVIALLEAGSNYSLPDSEGWLPIHIAASWNFFEVVETLVAFGANIDVLNSNGATVFDVCEPQFKDRLFEIKSNIETIRSNFKFDQLPQSKSFRKSRGSSVRRTSVKHKNMMSRKEAKEEFLTMNLPVVAHSDEKCEEISDMSKEDDTSSDIDSIKVELPKVIGTPKHEINHPIKPVFNTTKPKESPSITPIKNPPGSQNSTRVTRKTTNPPVVLPNSVATNNNNHEKLNNNHQTQEKKVEVLKIQDVQLEISPEASQTVKMKQNDVVGALNQPRYKFSSSSASWDPNHESKKTRRRGCCNML